MTSFGLLRIQLLQMLCNSCQLDIARPLIDSTNLAIPEILLRQPLSYESHTTHPLDSLAGDLASNLRGIQLGHSGVHNEVFAGLLLAGGIVDEGARSANLGPRLCELVLHALKFADQLTELLAVIPGVSDQSQHLSFRM